ncbi:hypothetical protein KCP71_21110 [Salmonella enterica subsp. enterica]|nr:hypothetical protein KCP71_21110 [Salmonella enterica subsp. enterica]
MNTRYKRPDSDVYPCGASLMKTSGSVVWAAGTTCGMTMPVSCVIWHTGHDVLKPGDSDDHQLRRLDRRKVL